MTTFDDADLFDPRAAWRSADHLQDVRQQLAPSVHQTPIVTCQTLSQLAGCQLFFKAENLQKVGAFKIRGATNAVLSLSEAQVARGVVTHSSGNHAAAVAQAARWRGLTAQVVMPDNSPAIKVAAVKGYGGQVIFCPPTQQDREATAQRIIDETGAHFIHPYDDPRVMAGQSTVLQEMIEQVPDLDAVVVPVGGGGLLAGTILARNALAPRLAIYAAEPAQADDAFRSIRSGIRQEPHTQPTLADGLKTGLGKYTWPIIHAGLADIALADESHILNAWRMTLERAKTVIEPSAALGLAVLLQHPWPDLYQKRVGVILTGGNVDLPNVVGQLS